MLALLFIIPLVPFIVGISVPPTFIHEPNPPKIYLVDGRSQELRCEATGSPAISYRWLKDGNEIDVDQYFSGRINKSAAQGLTFSFINFTFADVGIYQCSAGNQLGLAKDRKIKITRAFIEPLPKKHHNLELKGGMPYSIHCPKVSSEPRARLFWVLTNEPSTPTGRPSGARQFFTLNMSNVISNKKGDLFFQYLDNLPPNSSDVFMCCAENPELKEYTFGPSYSIRLKWDAERKINDTWAEQYYSPETVTVRRGKSIDLFCLISGRNVVPPQWGKLDGQFNESRVYWGVDYKKSLTINNADYSDAGHYYCSFQNHPVYDRNFTVIVQGIPEWKHGPPESLNFTKSSKVDVTFDCEASAFPEPTVKFYKNGQELEYDDFHVKSGSKLIVKANYPETAVYQCRAENTEGAILTNFYRNVLP